MKQYLDMLRFVLEKGEVMESRAVLARDGSRPRTRSIFGCQNRYDLNDGFPLVTTKHVPFRQVAAELCWFLSGSTNVKDLHKWGVHIWDEWAIDSGRVGPIYGRQWREFGLYDDYDTVDQISRLKADITSVAANPSAPEARRLILISWNPLNVVDAWAPMGCHTLCQFSVRNGKLSSHLYQRSADMFLGVPWNIACYAALTHLFAHLCGLGVGEFIHSFGDAHIYENHIPQVEEQLKREPMPLPTLAIDSAKVEPTLYDLTPDAFVLTGYKHHPKLTGEVAI